MTARYLQLLLFFLVFTSICMSDPVYERNGGILQSYAVENRETSFSIPEGVTEIASGCFAGQWKNPVLKRIILPSSLQILPTAFWQEMLESLESIEVSESNPLFASVQGVLFSKDMKQLICYPPCRPAAAYELPSTVMHLGPWCFRDSRYLQEVHLSGGLESIGEGAFYDCRRLYRLSLPASVSSVREDAFLRCREDSAYEVYYNGILFLDSMSNPYGKAEYAAGTTVYYVGETLPEHFNTVLVQMKPFFYELHPGWNFYYIPVEHMDFLREKILSGSCSVLESSKRCYITFSGATAGDALFWIFSKGNKTEVIQGNSPVEVEIPASRKFFPGWNMKTCGQLRKSGIQPPSFYFWDAGRQRFRNGVSLAELSAETPVWISENQEKGSAK